MSLLQTGKCCHLTRNFGFNRLNHISFAFRSHRCACPEGYFGDGCEFEILKEKSRSHPVLRIIGYGIFAVLVVAIATVAYQRTLGTSEEKLEGTRTSSTAERRGKRLSRSFEV